MALTNFPDLLTSALQGDVKALEKLEQYRMANLFSENDITYALERIHSAMLSPTINNNTQRGHAFALRAYMYQRGIGQLDYAEAIRMNEIAILFNIPTAMNNRAGMHQHGLGCSINYPEAIRLYEMAMKHDDYVIAIINRAHMYRKGLGGPVNTVEAVRLDALVNNILTANHVPASSVEKALKATDNTVVVKSDNKKRTFLPSLSDISLTFSSLFKKGNHETSNNKMNSDQDESNDGINSTTPLYPHL